MHIGDLKLAISLKATKGRKYEINQIYPRDFFALADEVNFQKSESDEILDFFAMNVPAALQTVLESLPDGFSLEIVDSITRSMTKLHARLI
ncbi:hypothetical protein ABFP38_003577 [Enterobacter hormaechei]